MKETYINSKFPLVKETPMNKGIHIEVKLMNISFPQEVNISISTNMIPLQFLCSSLFILEKHVSTKKNVEKNTNFLPTTVYHLRMLQQTT